TSLLPVAFNYRNQVNMWTSDDSGASWRRVTFPGGFQTNPAQNTGFSDPDLTQDEAGRVYNTGIDLVNDSLFSSNDGGKNWDNGNVNAIGTSVWKPGDTKITPVKATDTTVFGHFPIVTFDNADNLYLIWDTNDRVKGTSGGCTDNPAVTVPNPAPNHIMMAVS